MAQHILENEYLKVTVEDYGAELISVYDKVNGYERIWTGDPAVWNRHSPILFPFVGRLMNGQYRVGNKTYAMKTQHGFARDMAFTCEEETPLSVKHCLKANDWTREIYPFDFRLTVVHHLSDRQLRVEWLIENLGDERMIFSIGGHPGFLMPEGIRKEDCYIVFPGRDALRYIGANRAGYALPLQNTLRLEDGFAHYQDDIPDTWIFEDHQVKTVGIATPDKKICVMLNCEQFPMLAVWANPGGPFICLEPWFGRTDDEGFCGGIDEKKAIEFLESEKRKEITYSIEFK